MASPQTMQAYIAQPSSLVSRLCGVLRGGGLGHKGGVSQVPVPQPLSDQILVKVESVAQNPTDHMHLSYISRGNAIIGCDYAGRVHQVGSSVTGWRVGDRVAGAVHGGVFHDKGSYAEYLVTDADLAWRIPDETTTEDATTFGIGAVAAMQGLFLHLDVPWPDGSQESNNEPGKKIYVHGGSSSVGLFAIQLAKMAGLEVVTTCSPRNNDLVRSYGADHIYDYRSPNMADQIRSEHAGIARALDCISERSTLAFCDKVLKDSPNAVIGLTKAVPLARTSANVKTSFFLTYTLFGKPFTLLRWVKFDAIPRDRAALAKFYAMLPALILERGLRPNPIDLRTGGIAAVETGLDEMRAGKVSGKKLVVTFPSSDEGTGTSKIILQAEEKSCRGPSL